MSAWAAFLVPDQVIEKDGTGPAVELGEDAGGLLEITLGVLEVVEQESLEVSVWGSAGGVDWGKVPLLTVPQKFYAGTSVYLLNLTGSAEVRHLQARWKVNRWGRGSLVPRFRLYVGVRAVGQ